MGIIPATEKSELESVWNGYGCLNPGECKIRQGWCGFQRQGDGGRQIKGNLGARADLGGLRLARLPHPSLPEDVLLLPLPASCAPQLWVWFSPLGGTVGSAGQSSSLGELQGAGVSPGQAYPRVTCPQPSAARGQVVCAVSCSGLPSQGQHAAGSWPCSLGPEGS